MKVLAINRKANFNYDILEKFEAGLELTGHEVKSAKVGKASLSGSYGIIRGNEVYVIGMEITPFQPKNAPKDYDPQRIRRLLLKKKEISHLIGKINEGLTLVGIRLYSKNGLIKIELGLGKGRKKKDRRDYLKSKEDRKEINKHI